MLVARYAAWLLTLLGCDPRAATPPVEPAPIASVEAADLPAGPSAAAAPSASAAAPPPSATAPAVEPVSLAIPAAIPASSPEETFRCPNGTCKLRVPADGAAPKAGEVEPPPAYLRAVELGKGARVTVDKRAALALVGVVLSGGARVEDVALAPLDGFSAKGGGITIVSDDGARLVLALIGTRKSDRSVMFNGGTWTERPAPVARFTLGGEPLRWDGGRFAAKIGLEGPDASCTLLGISSTAGVPQHQHDESWEMLAVLRGKGSVPLGPVEKRVDLSAQPGNLLSIPKATLHQFLPEELPMLAIQLYVPPGPEQRFKKLAAPPAP